MKKVKIIAILVLTVLAIGCIILPLAKIITEIKMLNNVKAMGKTELYEYEVKVVAKSLIFFTYPYFVLFTLLIFNICFIVFDFSLSAFSFHNFKLKVKKMQEKSKQQKYDRLKSKIEKMESDE